ncbi:hypothetical protein niasHT_008260 [Heterodera trifolii]|uniref:Uncharacterized protein n=1 Tax=Heterodera trifolii TaxID=157864 RepID=A0ABD2M193_9BILA
MKTKGREQLRKDIGGMFDQLQNVVGEEVAGLWAKIEPLLTEQARAHGALVEAFDEFVANFSAEKEKSPEPQPENEENEVPVAEGAENGENEENQGMMPQARGRGQFRAGVKSHPKNGVFVHPKNGGLVRSFGRTWDRAPPNCQCWSCRRARGWHGRGGGRGGGGPGYGFGMRGGRGAHGHGCQQHVGPSHR